MGARYSALSTTELSADEQEWKDSETGQQWEIDCVLKFYRDYDYVLPIRQYERQFTLNPRAVREQKFDMLLLEYRARKTRAELRSHKLVY